MLLEFDEKIASFMRETCSFVGGEKILVAVSGGGDSIALLHTLNKLRRENVFDYELYCAHVNHSLRGCDSDMDQDYVIRESQKLDVPVESVRVDVASFARVNKLSIETAAREMRIRSLLAIAKERGCELIATGHHKDDNAETVLHRLGRGTGFRGLGGIGPRRSFGDNISFVRPLLCVTRSEIINYLGVCKLSWQVDHTNMDCSYRRNYIRHRLIPELQKESGEEICEQLFHLSDSARRLHVLISSRAESIWPEVSAISAEGVSLELKVFLSEPEPVKIELIRKSLSIIGCGEQGMTQQHFEGILNLALSKRSGKRIVLPGGFEVGLEYERLVCSRISAEESRDGPVCVEVQIPGQTRFGEYLIEASVYEAGLEGGTFKAGKTSYVEWFDLDKISGPLEVRLRKAGDYFRPLGQSGNKKISRFLIDQRVPRRIRKGTLLVADREKIIWLWPIRICEDTKITPETRAILRLQITDAAVSTVLSD